MLCNLVRWPPDGRHRPPAYAWYGLFSLQCTAPIVPTLPSTTRRTRTRPRTYRLVFFLKKNKHFPEGFTWHLVTRQSRRSLCTCSRASDTPAAKANVPSCLPVSRITRCRSAAKVCPLLVACPRSLVHADAMTATEEHSRRNHHVELVLADRSERGYRQCKESSSRL